MVFDKGIHQAILEALENYPQPWMPLDVFRINGATNLQLIHHLNVLVDSGRIARLDDTMPSYRLTFSGHEFLLTRRACENAEKREY